MRFLTLNFIKKHSRLDYDNEDDLLELYADSAEATIASILNRGDTVDEMVDSLEEQYGAIPAPVIEAGLMLVDLSYQQPNPVSPTNMSPVPYGSLETKLKRYIILAD